MVAIFDSVFAAVVSGVSLDMLRRYLAGTPAEQRGKVPVHFDWWGQADNWAPAAYAQEAAVFYVLLSSGLAVAPLLANSSKQRALKRELALARIEADDQAKGTAPWLRFIKQRVAPLFSGTLFMRSASLMCLALQHCALEQSRKKTPDAEAFVPTLLFRPLLAVYVVTLVGHAALGTYELM